MNGDASRDRPRRTALVTGSTQGIGRGIAEWLAREGRTVGINGRDPGRVQAVVDEFAARGWRAYAAPGSVTEPADIERMVEAAVAATGTIDILVSNAGGIGGVKRVPHFEQFPLEDWHEVLNRNVTAAFLLSRAAVPHMKARGWGRIVYIASESARLPIVPPGGGYAYAAAKAGIIGFARVLATEVAPYGITVNTLTPGFTKSNPEFEKRFLAQPEEARRERVRGIKLGRWAEVSEIASAVGYLVSEDASYCVGAVLDVNGGSYMP